MIILQDFREKRGHHKEIEEYCEQNDILLHRLSLDVGDYMLGKFENGRYSPVGTVSIDTKQDLEELASDLHRDKLEYNKKYRKCFEQGIKLIVLVQQPIVSLSQILKWKSKHSNITGRYLYELMERLRLSYGIQFKFCDKKNVGKVVRDLLTYATIAQN